MPYIRMVTNVDGAKIPEDFEVHLTNEIAKAMSKPANRIAVEIDAGARLVHGSTKDPAAVINIQSIGSISAENNIATSKALTSLCETINIPKDKVLIFFNNMSRENVGFNGTTVAAST